MSTIERYAAPRSMEEAVRILAEGEATLFAGSTDIVPQTQSGVRTFKPTLVNIRRLAELKGITQEGEAIRIGALATVAEVEKSDLLREKARILPFTADCFASGQIRNSATIGGNVCNASPAGDLIIPLILLDAEVSLASWQGGSISVRRMAITDFFTGPGRTRLKAQELLSSFYFPVPGKGFTARFKKFGTRPAMDISVVSVGIAGIRDKNALKEVRVAFGAVAPTPMRGEKTEAVLEGKAITEELIARAARTAAEEIDPISDVRASAWYRKQLIHTFTERLLRNVC